MKKEITNFKRKELFEHYNTKDNPFIIVTTKINITNLYKKCKTYYATIGYFLAIAVNQVENFKYRYEDGKIYYYDKVNPNFTDTFHDKNIGFFTCKLKETYKEFMKEYQLKRTKFLNTNSSYSSEEQDEIWFSCTPWFQMTSAI